MLRWKELRVRKIRMLPTVICEAFPSIYTVWHHMHPANIYLFKANNRNTKKGAKCSKLTTKTLKTFQTLNKLCTYFAPFSSVSVAEFKQVNVSWARLQCNLLFSWNILFCYIFLSFFTRFFRSSLTLLVFCFSYFGKTSGLSYNREHFFLYVHLSEYYLPW